MIAHYPTLTDLWHKTAQGMLFAKADDLDFIASIDTMQYGNALSCDSMSFKFDLGRDLWLTRSRFTVLQRAYIDAVEYASFLDRCAEIAKTGSRRGVITEMTARKHPRAEKKYKWGNCMLGWTFRGGGREQPTLTLHSRVSYIAYIGGLDLALCHIMAREIGERIGARPRDFAFRWNVDSLQFHGFKSIPYLFRFGLDDQLRYDTGQYPSSEYPTLKLVRRWWGVMVDEYERKVPLTAQKYGPLRRIRRRYQEYAEGNPLPPVPVKTLHLDKLR